jgi:hypothetical protein
MHSFCGLHWSEKRNGLVETSFTGGRRSVPVYAFFKNAISRLTYSITHHTHDHEHHSITVSQSLTEHKCKRSQSKPVSDSEDVAPGFVSRSSPDCYSEASWYARSPFIFGSRRECGLCTNSQRSNRPEGKNHKAVVKCIIHHIVPHIVHISMVLIYVCNVM